MPGSSHPQKLDNDGLLPPDLTPDRSYQTAQCSPNKQDGVCNAVSCVVYIWFVVSVIRCWYLDHGAAMVFLGFFCFISWLWRPRPSLRRLECRAPLVTFVGTDSLGSRCVSRPGDEMAHTGSLLLSHLLRRDLLRLGQLTAAHAVGLFLQVYMILSA